MTSPDFRQAIDWSTAHLVSDRDTVTRMMDLADALTRSCEWVEAERCLQRAAVLAESLHDCDNTRCDLFVIYGRLLTILGKLEAAAHYLERANALIESGHVKRADHSDVYAVMASLFEKKGDVPSRSEYLLLQQSATADLSAQLIQRLTHNVGAGGSTSPRLSSIANRPNDPIDWKHVVENHQSGAVLPLPSDDELICLAAIAQYAHNTRQSSVTTQQLKSIVAVNRPHWDGFELRQVAQRAVARGFLSTHIVERSRHTGSPQQAVRSHIESQRSSGAAFDLAIPPTHLLAAICRGALKSQSLTDETRNRLLTIADLMLSGSTAKLSFREWLSSL